MKLIRHVRKMRNRHNSFWYEGRIASIGNYHLIASGEIRVLISEEIGWHYNSHAVEKALELKMKDVDIDSFQWENNNWFEVIYDNGKEIDYDMGVVAFDYDEGIKLLKQYYKEKFYDRLLCS